MEKYAVIVAGGSGIRMGTTIPKQFLLLNGKPVLWYTLQAFIKAYNDLSIILVVPFDFQEQAGAIVADTDNPERILITVGGSSRFQSVKNGLGCIKKASMIFVHDGVRCLVTPHLIQKCFAAAATLGNAIPTVGLADSVRIEHEGGNQIIDRSKLRIIQTPQTFLSDILQKAFEQDFDPAFTDEASVVERLGIKINLIAGEETNIKITKPADLWFAAQVLDQKNKG